MFVNYPDSFKPIDVSRRERPRRSPIRPQIRPELVNLSPQIKPDQLNFSDKKRKFDSFAEDFDPEVRAHQIPPPDGQIDPSEQKDTDNDQTDTVPTNPGSAFSSILHYVALPFRVAHSIIYNTAITIAVVTVSLSPYKRRLVEVKPKPALIPLKHPQPKPKSRTYISTIVDTDMKAKSRTTTTSRPRGKDQSIRRRGKSSNKQNRSPQSQREDLQALEIRPKAVKASVFPPPVVLAPANGFPFYPPTNLSLPRPTATQTITPPPSGEDKRMSTGKVTPTKGKDVKQKATASLLSPPTSNAPVITSRTTEPKGETESLNIFKSSLNLPSIAALSLGDDRKGKDKDSSEVKGGKTSHDYPFFVKVGTIWNNRKKLFYKGGNPKLEHHLIFQRVLLQKWFDEPSKKRSDKFTPILIALLQISGNYPSRGITGSIFDIPGVRNGIRQGIYLLVTIPDHFQHGTSKPFIKHANQIYEAELESQRSHDLLKSRSRSSYLTSLLLSSRTASSGVLPPFVRPEPARPRKLIQRDAFASKVIWLDENTPEAEPSPTSEEEKKRTAAQQAVVAPTGVISLDESDEEEAETPETSEDETIRPFFQTSAKIITTLPQKWETLVAKALGKTNPQESVYDGLSRKDIGTLCPTGSFDSRSGWLNDEVINELLTHVKKAAVDKKGTGSNTETPIVHAFSSFWFTQVSTRGVESVARWSKRAKIDNHRLWDVEHLFVPINPGGHWMLLHIAPRAKLVEHYDSMNGSPNRYLQIGRDFLALHLGADAGADDTAGGGGATCPKYDESEWVFRRGVSNLQSNCNDCGVFTVWNAIALSMGLEPSSVVTQELMPLARRLSVAVLLNGGFKGDFAI